MDRSIDLVTPTIFGKEPPLDETTSLLYANAQQAEQWRLMLFNFLTIWSIVGGTYYWYALVTSIEHDPYLDWTQRTTTLVNSLSCLSEMIGLLFLGPLADLVSISSILAFNSIFLCVMLGFELTSCANIILVGCISLTSVCKGILWPAICKLTAACMPSSKQDMTFLFSSFASRTAGMSSALILGGLMSHLDLNWRQATAVFLLVITGTLSWARSLYPHNLSRHMLAKQTANISAGRGPSLATKIYNFLADSDAWLVMCTVVGSGTMWALNFYSPLLLEDLYGMSEAKVVSVASIIPIGMMCGLVFATMSSVLLGTNIGRFTQVCQVGFGASSLFYLSFNPRITFHRSAMLLAMGGFGAVVPCYIPSLLFSAKSPEDERGFRMSAVMAVAQISTTCLTYFFGKLRERSESIELLAARLYFMPALGMLVSMMMMGSFYSSMYRADQRRMLLETAPVQTKIV